MIGGEANRPRFTGSIEMALYGKSPDDLLKLAEAGASLELDARRYSVHDLIKIGLALTPNCLLILDNCEDKPQSELLALAAFVPEG
jgi:hypothetical protein